LNVYWSEAFGVVKIHYIIVYGVLLLFLQFSHENLSKNGFSLRAAPAAVAAAWLWNIF
jgi:hypothetical protein